MRIRFCVPRSFFINAVISRSLKTEKRFERGIKRKEKEKKELSIVARFK